VSAHVIALTATLVLAALARLYRLANIPNGFSPDEASYGYNGYSFLLTGRDRFGNAFPLFADNFGDLISTSYMWLTVPSIWLFGLDEFAVRLPAALAGIVTVFVLYKLGPLFFCLGLWLFLRWRKEGGRKLLWSVLCFGLCFYTYASARVFAPLFIAGAALLYFRELRAAGRYALWPLGILVACFLPAALHWISPAGMARASYLLEFAPFDWLVNYLSYLGPDYLFFNGDPEIRHSLLNVGQLYFFELATLPMGIFFLVRRKRKDPGSAHRPVTCHSFDCRRAAICIGVGVRFVSGGAFCARAKPLVVGAGVHRDGGWQRSGLWSALLSRLPRLRGRALELWDAGGNALRGGRVPPSSLHQQSHLFIPYIRLVLFSLSS
jgi:hypothetical protein